MELIALLLAGGKGTRLEDLTKKNAKPAVYFGGKYRIIDFALSNCVNSKIKKIGVITQYEPTPLNSYLGNGSHWGCDGSNYQLIILPPHQKETGATWYQGTADAISQNMDFINHCKADHVLILSGDHIYKMDYTKMLDVHLKKKAELTIACINVPLEEASRFGIISVNEDGKLIDFVEKPKEPKSTLASMGVYIFSTEALKKYLALDYQTKRDEYDFGKHIIPLMIENKAEIYTYAFSGYWKDVGTLDSLWQANMDLIGSSELDIHGQNSTWKIYSEDTMSKPQYIYSSGRVITSLINQGCQIAGTVSNSVLFNDVVVEEGAIVDQCVVFPNVVIKKDMILKKCIVAENTTINKNIDNSANNKVVLISR
jgi:glucose-1-phosphate adenylyltransferase